MLIFTDIFRKKALGLDIGNERVAGVLVERKAGSTVIHSADYIPFQVQKDIPAATHELLKNLNVTPDVCITGLPVSHCFIRNVSLPFLERKKINKVLPLELEDQLINSVDELVLDYTIGNQSESQSSLVIAAVSQREIQEHLDVLEHDDLDPEIISLRSLVFARNLVANEQAQQNSLLLEIEQYSVTIVLMQKGKIIYIRQLPYSDDVLTDMPFHLSQGTLYADNIEGVNECIGKLCKNIVHSLSLFGLENNIEPVFSHCFLTGSLALAEIVRGEIQSALGVQVETTDLRNSGGIELQDDLKDIWQPQIYDHALSLAVSIGVRQKDVFNFRRGVFKRKPQIFRSKRQLAMAAGLLLVACLGLGIQAFLGYSDLKNRYASVGNQMNQLFLDTFPDTTRIVDPLQQMKVNVQQAESSGGATPIIAQSKKNLELLADISARIPKSLEIHVTRLLVDQESVQIKGTTKTFNTVDGIQNQLRQSPFFDEVAIMSATADKNKEQIRFQIRLTLAERG